LIRQITVSNNRQNQIAASALHANDPVQVQLAERFKQHGVFYQRQEGAFAELEESSPALLETEYPQTNGGYVDMEDLARCLAAIAGELDFAHSPGRIFEYDAAYERCFSQRRLRSIVFLTFLQNVHNVLSLVLKKDLGLTRSGNGLRPSRLTYYVMCLLMRHLAKERKRSLVIEHGTAISRGSLRSEIAKVLDNYHSGIKRALQEKFLEIDDTRSESLKDAFRRAEVSLRLKANIDPFEEFADLDETVA
jgi:hypothetical protein